MDEYFAQHPWILGLLIFGLAFTLNTIRRLITESRKIPRETELELNMRRAARALRKLGRARRILRRLIAMRNAAQGQPMPKMARRRWKVSTDVVSAMDHLSAVLKKAPNLGCSLDVMRNIDGYIEIAESTREEYRLAVRAKMDSDIGAVSLTQEQMAALIQDCTETLDRARAIVDEWVTETEQAGHALAATTDSMILRSGGILRNPFRPEDSVEIGQTESVISLRWTIEDIARTNRCIGAIQKAVNILQSSQYDVIEMKRLVSDALDSIDIALGDAELPLPEGLAEGETPFDTPSDEEPSGALQKIYACLTTVEAALISVGTQR